jgi:hypothetical protein
VTTGSNETVCVDNLPFGNYSITEAQDWDEATRVPTPARS